MKYTINQIPATEQELESLKEVYSATPEGAVALTILALQLASSDLSNTEKIMKIVNPGISQSMIQLVERQLSKSPYLPQSYFQGTTPDNHYALPTTNNFDIDLTTNRYSGTEEEGRIKYFIACSGADSPRPVAVKKNEYNNWLPHEFSSLIVGIREPSNG